MLKNCNAANNLSISKNICDDVVNDSDLDESHKLLLSNENVVDETKSGHNVVDNFANATNAIPNDSEQGINVNNVKNNSNNGIDNRTFIDNSTSFIIEYPTKNPFKLDLMSFENGKQNLLTNNRKNTKGNFQRNSNSLEHLLCKQMEYGTNAINLRRTKSSTGIYNSSNLNEFIDVDDVYTCATMNGSSENRFKCYGNAKNQQKMIPSVVWSTCKFRSKRTADASRNSSESNSSNASSSLSSTASGTVTVSSLSSTSKKSSKSNVNVNTNEKRLRKDLIMHIGTDPQANNNNSNAENMVSSEHHPNNGNGAGHCNDYNSKRAGNKTIENIFASVVKNGSLIHLPFKKKKSTIRRIGVAEKCRNQVVDGNGNDDDDDEDDNNDNNLCGSGNIIENSLFSPSSSSSNNSHVINLQRKCEKKLKEEKNIRKDRNTNPFLNQELNEMECIDIDSNKSHFTCTNMNAIAATTSSPSSSASNAKKRSVEGEGDDSDRIANTNNNINDVENTGPATTSYNKQFNDVEEPIPNQFNTKAIMHGKSNWINESKCFNNSELFNNKSLTNLDNTLLTDNFIDKWEPKTLKMPSSKLTDMHRSAVAIDDDDTIDSLHPGAYTTIRKHHKTRRCRKFNKDWKHIQSTDNLLMEKNNEYQSEIDCNKSSGKQHHYPTRKQSNKCKTSEKSNDNDDIMPYQLQQHEITKSNTTDSINDEGDYDVNDTILRTMKLDNNFDEFSRQWSDVLGSVGEHTSEEVQWNFKKNNIDPINDIPTCPFQRQDYNKPFGDEEFDMIGDTFTGNRTLGKKLKKDSLLGLTLQKGKSLTNTISRVASAGSVKITTLARNPSNSSGTSTKNHSPKLPHLKKLNINYPNKTQFNDFAQSKEDRKYFDKTKKNLIKIGQKCGLKMTAKDSEKNYQTTLLNPHTTRDQLLLTSSASNIEKMPYKSYRSEIDLTKNLHHLDVFLNENFDVLNKPESGSQSIGKCIQRKNYIGHKRTKSYSKSVDTRYNDSTSIAPKNFINYSCTDPNEMLYALPSDYYVSDAQPIASTSKRYHGTVLSNNSDKLLKVSSHPIASHLHTQQQRTISSSTSDSFNTLNSSKSMQSKMMYRRPDVGGASSDRDATFTIPNYISSSCERSAKSYTTSSSLSSDYASVYSPSSNSNQLSESNNQQNYLSSDPNSMLQHISTEYTNMAKPLEISPKRNNRLKLLDKYDKHKRHSLCNEIYDEFMPLNFENTASVSVTTTTTTTTASGEPLKLNLLYNDIVDPDGFHDDHDNEIAHNNYRKDVNEKDKLLMLEKSFYQYENQLPHHEDYLQHYYNNLSNRMELIEPNDGLIAQMIQIPLEQQQQQQLQQSQRLQQHHQQQYHQSNHAHHHHHHHRQQQQQQHQPFDSRLLQTTSNQYFNTQTQTQQMPDIQSRKQQNFAQHRVVMTKSNDKDIVLEYEC